MKSSDPVVSVIIPTRNRLQLVTRAVRSALKQTLETIEVIVIIDGPDEGTLKTLLQIEDPRLRVVMLSSHLGAGGARNAGVKEARSQWIAFLDDDDEWFPQKLEIQYHTAQQSSSLYPIISCRLIARKEWGDLIWPLRYPRPEEILSEYMFCQRGFFGGEGQVITSAIFTRKELLKKVPFKREFQGHEDWDWLLRACTLKGTGLEFVKVSDPLLIWHIEDNRSRISNRMDWSDSLSWVQANRHLFTRQAYASFIMIQVSLHAARMRDWKGFLMLLWQAFRHGKPSFIDFIAYMMIWLIPQKIRDQIVLLFKRRFANRK